jgi:protein JSN1
LDYLGLDDTLGGRSNPTPATVTELRAQAQAALTGSLSSNPSRNRATTVSNPYRLMGLQGGAGAISEDELLNDDYNDLSMGNPSRSLMDPYESNGPVMHSNAMSQGYRESQLMNANNAGRARANTMGNLDDPRLMGMRRGYEEDAYESELAGMAYGQPISGSILKDGRGVRSNGISNSVRFPPGEPNASRGLNYGMMSARPPSPKGDMASQVQTPSRSLWIGNLDSTFTSEDLIRVFAPYGAIESLRLLPEKVI